MIEDRERQRKEAKAMARFGYVDVATGRRGEGKTTWQAMMVAWDSGVIR